VVKKLLIVFVRAIFIIPASSLSINYVGGQKITDSRLSMGRNQYVIAGVPISRGGFTSPDGVVHPSGFNTSIHAYEKLNNSSVNYVPTVSVTICIFNREGKIDIGGTYYSNGQTILLDEGIKYTVSPADLSSGFTFFEWEEYGGTLSGTSNSWSNQRDIAFTPYSQYCGLALILNSSSANWAGYVESSQSGILLDSASATITVPKAVYVAGVTNSSTYPVELISEWVGIGGYFRSGSLTPWQAGVDIRFNNSGSTEWIRSWYENATNTTSYTVTPAYINFHISPGDKLQISIS